MGGDEVWDKSDAALKESLTGLNIPFTIAPGDGAFYGPKVEIHFVDAIGRSWQLGTIQVDFNLPEAFNLEYIGEDNSGHRPVMLHRAILGSLERFIGIYIEHCAGHFRLGLRRPKFQFSALSKDKVSIARNFWLLAKKPAYVTHYDARNEKLGYKIREAQLQKTPYMLIIGDAEMEKKTLSVRLNNGQMVNNISVDEFINSVSKEIRERALSSPYLSDATNSRCSIRLKASNQEARN